jgi:hydroxyacylglutathione hydrolase
MLEPAASEAASACWRLVLTAALAPALIVAGCSAATPSPARPDAPAMGLDAAAGLDGPAGLDAPALDAAPTGLVPGTLDVAWMHGSQNCRDNSDPEVQVHAYNATTYIIRQNKCLTFEAPFIYLLIGTRSALSLDTGATNTAKLRDTIKGLIGDKPLVVAHSHAHGDHTASDGKFAADPKLSVVPNTVAGQQAQFGITTWPDSLGGFDLGDRALDVIAIPGHEQTHIAIYDRQTGILLTGDSLYPGLLFIPDWTTYRASIHRLAAFAATRVITHVLGAHVEMTSTPKVVYPYGTTFQPDEHVLQLSASHLTELSDALDQLGPRPPSRPVAHDDFVINPT